LTELKYNVDTIASNSAGEGSPPVLLFHGWGGNQTTMNSIAERLSNHRHTVSLALPGFGDSPEPPQSWGTWEYVETLYRWITAHFPNQPVDLIAHSFGGRIAIGLASRHPALVGKLVLIGSAGLRPKRSLRVNLKRFYSKQLRN